MPIVTSESPPPSISSKFASSIKSFDNNAELVNEKIKQNRTIMQHKWEVHRQRRHLGTNQSANSRSTDNLRTRNEFGTNGCQQFPHTSRVMGVEIDQVLGDPASPVVATRVEKWSSAISAPQSVKICRVSCCVGLFGKVFSYCWSRRIARRPHANIASASSTKRIPTIL